MTANWREEQARKHRINSDIATEADICAVNAHSAELQARRIEEYVQKHRCTLEHSDEAAWNRKFEPRD